MKRTSPEDRAWPDADITRIEISHCSRPLTHPRQYVMVEVKTSGQELRDAIQFRLEAPFTLLARANEAIEQATAPW